MKYGKGGRALRALANEGGSKAVAEAYGFSRRTAQRVLKGEISERTARAIAAGPIVAPTSKSKPYRERGSTARAATEPRAQVEPPKPTTEAARVADERPIREIVAEQKLVAGKLGGAIVDGVLCVTEASLKAAGVEYRPIRTATFPELSQALANAHETVIRGNEGVPYAIVLAPSGRYYGVILGSNTDPGAIYDDEGFQALIEFAEREGEDAPSGWEDYESEDDED